MKFFMRCDHVALGFCVVVASAFIAPTEADAQVYKCVRGGEVRYQQQPCESAVGQTELSVPESSGVRIGPSHKSTAQRNPPAAVSARNEPPPALPAARANSPGCNFPWRPLPPDALIYAVTLSGGRHGSGFPIDESGEEVQIEEIIVNQPGKRVALLLSFTNSTAWFMKWTPGTEILAVWASGNNRQGVAGLPKSVPLLRTDEKFDKSPCGWFAFYVQHFPRANEVSLKAFQRPVTATVTLGRENWVGAKPDPNIPLQWSDEVTVRSLESKEGWNHGRMALVRLEREGYVRKAFRKEVWDWEDQWAKKNDVPPVQNLQRPGRPTDEVDFYVVQKPFHVPNLMGGNLLVPKGMSPPTGDMTLIGILDWNTLTCCGGACHRLGIQLYPRCGQPR